MATLEDLRGVLTSVNDSMLAQGATFSLAVESQSSILANISESMSMQVQTMNEILGIQKQMNDREKKAALPKPDTSTLPAPASTEVPAAPSAAKAYGQELGEGLLAIPSGLLAAGAALALAFAGFRGWELKFLSQIKDGLGNLGTSIIDGVKNLKVGIFSAFGLDIDGKPMSNSVLDNILKNPIMEKLTVYLSKIFAPIRAMGDFLEGLFTGSGGDDTTKKAVGFLSKMGTGIGEFASVVGKILKPIGILFSVFDGVSAFMNTEGDFFDKFAAGIGGFLGDFIGAPLDLLKSVVAWGMSKLGFENAAEFLESFSFETLIGDIINSVYEMVRGAVEWVGTLFTDPITALTELWNAYAGEGGLADMLFAPVSMAIDWITKKLGWREEDAPPFNLRDFIANTITLAYNTVTEKFTQLGEMLSTKFGEFSDYLSTIPDRIMFAAEEMFIDVSARVEKGFITLGDWIASIPARIKLLALGAINSAMSGLPEWAQIVSAEDVAAAESAVNTRAASSQESLAGVDKRTEEKKADLLARKEASGIYDTSSSVAVIDSAAKATAESELISKTAEQSRLEMEAQRIKNFQAQSEMVENRSKGKDQAVAVVDSSSRTDARTFVGGTTNTTIITPRSSNDLDYGLPRAGF